MPEQEDGAMAGFQLWVNLPAKNKMTAPRYQDTAPENIPEVKFAGGTVRVIAGAFAETIGPVSGVDTEPLYLDVAIDPGASFTAALSKAHNAFAYAFQGSAEIGTTELKRSELGVLTHGDTVEIRASAEGTRLILVAGRPLGETIVRYGPIVMNTRAELERAFADLRSGNF